MPAETPRDAAGTDQGGTDCCARCGRRFDSTDTAFDGAGRHGDGPYCRSCVDACHEAGIDHRCVICEPANEY